MDKLTTKELNELKKEYPNISEIISFGEPNEYVIEIKSLYREWFYRTSFNVRVNPFKEIRVKIKTMFIMDKSASGKVEVKA